MGDCSFFDKIMRELVSFHSARNARKRSVLEKLRKMQKMQMHFVLPLSNRRKCFAHYR